VILDAVAKRPDTTLAELRELLVGHGVTVGIATLWRFFAAVAILRAPPDHAQKKSGHAAEQDRPDVVERREAWFEGQLDLDPHRLVFIDETGASTKMARLHGRAPRGQRLRMSVPHGHWKTTTFTAPCG